MHWLARRKTSWFCPVIIACCTLAGCHRAEVVEQEKAPRAVSVITLEPSTPTVSRRVSATVGSWKTEQIGFEVSGRVRWVLEPGEEIEGRVFDSQGGVITPGTMLAQVDSERYELALEAAKAQVSVAQLQKQGVEVNLASGIPADLEAAQADLELAQVEFNRNERLVAKNATAQADLDQSQAQLRTARAQIATIQAREKQTQAELEASIASVKQAQQNLKDAERNLADTTLFSSFQGQVADVHVVPGSVVSQGSPVLTVQMMNPIKVEVELSADQSRTIRERRTLPVHITMPDGSVAVQEGYVYTVSPTADTSTRTFTLTLLLLNRVVATPLPPEHRETRVARTVDVWRLDLDFLPDKAPGTYYIEKTAIQQDAEGHYVWKCLNAQIGKPVPRVLEVAKVRVTPGDRGVPFLGNWVFQAMTINEGQRVDPTSDLFAGELEFDDDSPENWDGRHVFLDPGAPWMLRPGDLAEVDLSESDTAAGYYVPLDAIYEESGETFVFVVEDSGSGATAKRTRVEVVGHTGGVSGTTRRISPLNDAGFAKGMRIVASGVHFLRDGEAIRLVQQD